MKKDDTLTYRVTFEDTFFVSAEIEQEYGCAVLWRHHAWTAQQKAKYSVELVAYRIEDGGELKKLCTAYVSYPSQQHGSMPGAVLDGLYDLESRLAAQRILQGLPRA